MKFGIFIHQNGEWSWENS